MREKHSTLCLTKPMLKTGLRVILILKNIFKLGQHGEENHWMDLVNKFMMLCEICKIFLKIKIIEHP